MAYRRRAAKSTLIRRRKPLYRRRMRIMKKIVPRVVTFTEVYPYETPTLLSNQGYILTTQFRDIPQNLQYSDLYKQFCIKKVQFILVPRWNSADAAGGDNLLRTAYSIQDTPSGVVPATELSVLENNGCKITTANRVLKITCYPKPLLQSDGSIVTGYAPAFNYRKAAWLNTDSPDNDPATSGTQLLHYGVSLFLSGLTNTTPVYDAFVKTTFSLRDGC